MRRKRPHPVALIVCLLGISALFAGCETVARHEQRTSAASRKESKRIEVFRTNTKPPSNVRDLGVLTEEGKLEDEAQIEAKFISKARFIGADALVFDPVMKIGDDVKTLATADTYLYQATLVKYAR